MKVKIKSKEARFYSWCRCCLRAMQNGK